MAITLRSPSKVPANYIQRTLARLLPPFEEVKKLPREQLLKFLQTKEDLAALIAAEPVRFFQPNEGGQTGYMTDMRGKRCLFYFAGNKGGKSTASVIRAGERGLGHALWDQKNRTNVKWPTPCRMAFFAEDFDSHKEVLIPTLLSWMPKGVIVGEQRNSQGHVIEHRMSSGSVIHYRSYDQGSEKAEGKDWHLVLFDEPPPRNVYTAAFRGVVATDGMILIGATLLKEAWLYDEIDQPHVGYYGGDIDDNKWLSQSAKDDFLNSLTEDEREVRKSGKPASLVGLIYKGFRDGPPFVGVDKDEPPEDCPTILAVDPHERKPCHAAWAYITPQNELIWFDWALPKGTVKEIKAELKAHESCMPNPPRICIMDPNRGSARQIQLETDQPFSWQTVFESFGYDVILANDNINYGHTTVRDYFSYTDQVGETPGLKPRMRFTESCRGKNGPVYQLMRYSWEDWSNRARMDRTLKERPKDRYKDFPDVIRYAACADLDYQILRHGPTIIDVWKDRHEQGIRAYA